MKNTREMIEEIIKVPADMLLDIFSIIVKEDFKHEVIEVLQSRSVVKVLLYYDKSVPRQQKVINNIHNILADYQHYRSWENEDFNWRE